ncbi:hypothetical protein B0T19DRAFT_446272 [Cercophora scortea]|uniref:Rhodopsin domain-containing protein n=1 Tax=Cercophora scortea TaxID=314031 RepID=A0AAE0I2B9_9PEZI|nr:hypothetical protein B0T19DRAFT_446272 [Cercophora scortea]
MTLYSPAPPLRPFSDDKPILLVSWWTTILCTFIILLRMSGRYIRVERLFPEDQIAGLAIIPLFLRMGLVHVILVYGTNNVDLNDENLRPTDAELRRRAIGSGLVLLSRIIYPAALWTLKLCTLQFFGRLIGSTGKKRYVLMLMLLRITLAASFLAVVVSVLAECTPFHNYWQVLPDPGGQCRQGYVSLITLSALNSFTNILLVVFPVPIIVQTQIALSRKIFLIVLFCLGFVTVGISIYRVPQVISEQGYQPTRTMWASVELLVATIVGNALVLGTFVRDTGIKKAKFKPDPYGSSSNARDGKRAPQVLSKKDSWDNTDDDMNPPTKEVIKPASIRGRDSQDSLIPRGVNATVVKTTRIEVTSSPAEVSDSAGSSTYLVHQKPQPSMTASNRGPSRGSTTKLLREVPLRRESIKRPGL